MANSRAKAHITTATIGTKHKHITTHCALCKLFHFESMAGFPSHFLCSYSVFKGEWLHGRKHGMGVFTTKNKSYREVWHEGVSLSHANMIICLNHDLVKVDGVIASNQNDIFIYVFDLYCRCV